MKYIGLICKGIIIGLAKIIPGVSGAIIAISLGIYERLIYIISKPLHVSLEDIKFLLCLLVGGILGIGIICKGVKFCLNHYYLQTILLFTGLIAGGIPDITKEIKHKFKLTNIIVLLISFGGLYYLINLDSGNSLDTNNYITYFFIGIIESLTTIIPGVSGTAIFLALGLYETLITIFEQLSNFSIDIIVLGLFVSGFTLSTILIAKAITFLFKRKKELAYSGVLGFMLCSLTAMLKNCLLVNFDSLELIIGLVLFMFGLYVTKKINTFFSKL